MDKWTRHIDACSLIFSTVRNSMACHRFILRENGRMKDTHSMSVLYHSQSIIELQRKKKENMVEIIDFDIVNCELLYNNMANVLSS